MQVVSQVAVLFLLLALGYSASKWRILNGGAFDGLNKLVLFFTLPCLTFMKLQREAAPGQMGELTLTFFLALLAMAACGGIAVLYTRKQSASRKAVFIHMAMFTNCGYMGYPLVLASLGDEKMIYAILYVAAFNLFTWTAGVYLYAGKTGISFKKALVNPALISVLLGLLFFALSLRVPKVLGDAMTMVGDTTTPLAMIIIGGRLSDLQWDDLKDGMLLFSCLMRLVVFPLTVLGILTVLPVSQSVREALFVCTAMPAATTTAMQADFYHGDARLGSRSVAVSTALSVITIPAILLLL